MEFGTEARFDAVVDSSSLRDARQTIEDDLGDVEVQVAAQVDGAGGGGGSTAVLDEFETEHQLSERRNELLEDLLDAQEQSDYTRAANLGGGLGGAMLAGVIGLGAAGLSALSNFEWPELPDLPQLKAPTIPPVPVDAPDEIPVDVPDPVPVLEPDWLPITVTKPDWLPLKDPGGGGTTSPGPTPSVDDLQDPTGTTDPTPAPAPLPDGIQNPGPAGSPSNVAPPVPGDDTQPTGDGNLLPNIGPEEIVGGVIAATGAGALGKFASNAGKGVGGAASTFAALPSFITNQAAQNSQERPRDQQTWFDRLVGDVLEGVDVGQQGTSTAAAATATGAPQLLQALDQGQTNDPGRESEPQPTTVNYSPTIELPVEELEQQYKQDLREIERRLNSLENAFGGGAGRLSR